MKEKLMTLKEAIEIMSKHNKDLVYRLENRIALLVREREVIIKCLKENRIKELKEFFNIK